ncbi:MAG: ABC transporter ATP-binding protein [Candidatus Taylorbacteria bacterium]|nr:ABC transporter ATP-binding protein [Candidatus Taylorbacteria bacterium]
MEKYLQYPAVHLGDVLTAFWQGLRHRKLWFFTTVASLVFLNIVEVFVPLFYRDFFDLLATGQTPAEIGNQLMSIIVMIAILHGIIWVCYRLSTYATTIYQPYTIAKLKQQSFDYLMNHSYDFFSNSFSGSLVQRVNRFARAFERLSDRLTWNVVPLFVKVAGVIVVVFFIQPLIATVLIVWVLVLLAVNILFSRWKIKYDIIAAAADSKTTGFLADTITNHNTVQLFSNLPSEAAGFEKVSNEQARSTKTAWTYDAVLEAIQSFMIFAIEFLLFYFTIKYWERGLVTIGVFVLFQAYIINLADRIWEFTRVIRDAYQGYADAKEMVEILLLPHGITDAPRAKSLEVASGQISLIDLNFSFNQTREVLRNINLTIKPGEKVALVGPSGAGKTTFVRLLLRLYQPTSGKILIDGMDIAHVTQKSLRQNIALVPQDPILFHRTLLDNIGYGQNGGTPEQIKDAGRLAHCDEFIDHLPSGYDTYVGERGIKLSGGERQRVAIGRAILKNAPILVLDEATSSLDSHSESLIQDALNTLMNGRTAIVIAHRLSTIQKMDRIIVIDKGQIAEEGSHEELLGRPDSLYKKLWSLQAGGFLKDQV